MRPYISGPMTGRTHHNFPAFFDAEAFLQLQGLKPLNPARTLAVQTWEESIRAHAGDNLVWCDYIKRDLKKLLEADSIVLLKGWEASRGACIELVAAVCIGYQVYHLVDDPRRLVHVETAEPEYQTALDTLKTFSVSDPWTMYNVV